MRAFLDTSVLVATFYDGHEHHRPSFDLFVNQEKKSGCTAAHSLAEVYSVLTGMPGKDRASGDEALLFLANIRDRLTIVTLDPEECFRVLEAAAAMGVTGGGIYDAVLGYCALKVKAETIFTWNVKHFTRLGQDITARVKTP